MSKETKEDSKSKIIANALAELKKASEVSKYLNLEQANNLGYVTIEQYVSSRDIPEDYSMHAYKKLYAQKFRDLYLEGKAERLLIKERRNTKYAYRVKKS